MKPAMTFRDVAILAFLAVAMSAVVLHLTIHLAPLCADNKETFGAAQGSFRACLDLRKEWRPRILSNLSARLCGRACLWVTTEPERHLKATIGVYSAGWLLLTNAVVILGFGRRALPLMWGVFAAVVFGYSPGVDIRVFPWDLPALFWFTAFLVCWEQGRYGLVSAVILAGAPFKETTVVLCAAILFFPLPWRRRIIQAALTGAGFVVLKVAVDAAVGNPLPFFSMSSSFPVTGPLIIFNFKTLLLPRLAHPVWINAGTLMAFLVLPGRSRTLLMLKTVVLLFAVNLFVFGMIREFRIWFEAAPLAVYGLLLHFGMAQPQSDATGG